MANEFIARKGLIVSGSTRVTNAVTASFFVGDGSNITNITATSASFATTASYVATPNINSTVAVDNYTFIGDGSTTQYQVSKSYSDVGVIVTVGGLTYIIPDDYSVSASTITFVEAPASQSNIAIKAFVNTTTGVTGSFSGSFAGDGSQLTNIPATVQTDNYLFVGNGSTKDFILSQSYNSTSVSVFVAGIAYVNPDDYSISGATVSLTSAPPSGSNVLIKALLTTSTQITGSFSGSFNGIATTASYVIPTGLPQGTVSSSEQISYTGLSNIPTGILSSSTQFNALSNTSASFATTASGLSGGTTNYIPVWSSTTVQSSSIIYQNSANIGIGTTSPGYKLEVLNGQIVANNTAGLNALIWAKGGGDAIDQGKGNFRSSDFGAGNYWEFGRDNLSTGNFVIASSGSSPSVSVTTAGNVGIGTTSPRTRLDIVGITSVQSIFEAATVSATAATGTIPFDVSTQSVLYYTTNASGNWTLNVRGNSGTTLNSILAVGQSVTIAFLVTNGGTAYYQTGFQIDGSSVTPRWQGGSAPTSGNTNSVDIYSITIIKTAATPTYNVFASQTRFA